MFTPTMIALYVESPLVSAEFYAPLLGRQPVEASPTFVLFILPSGVSLALWARHTVAPLVSVGAGGGELSMKVESDQAVEAMHAEWRDRGLPILQAPTTAGFGHSFVAADPDGHRLRVYALHA